MIEFKKIIQEEPYLMFQDWYNKAKDAGQKNIEAISIASYEKQKQEVDSRFVNLKFIEGSRFIFFSNYNSPKSLAFRSHDQISALFFWSSINVQIRIKARIIKTPSEYNQKYFFNRPNEKNALAISSNQSKKINSYEMVEKKFERSLEFDDLNKCPDYWGGFSFDPYYFEFWEGHKARLNKRNSYQKHDYGWSHSILQP